MTCHLPPVCSFTPHLPFCSAGRKAVKKVEWLEVDVSSSKSSSPLLPGHTLVGNNATERDEGPVAFASLVRRSRSGCEGRCAQPPASKTLITPVSLSCSGPGIGSCTAAVVRSHVASTPAPWLSWANRWLSRAVCTQGKQDEVMK